MNIRKPDVINNYVRHKEINNYLDYLAYRYCNFVTVFTMGKSFEGRPLKAIKIDLNKDVKGAIHKKWIFIEGGTHAREWITVSVALYCIYQLTEKSFHNRDVLDKIGFIIVPLVNPDGYEYSHEKNPFWRKNRRRLPNCKIVGIDCNRNYDYHWDNGSTKRSRSTYRGEVPFSEIETRIIRNIMQNHSANLKFFLSLHSYAETIMYPWGYTKQVCVIMGGVNKNGVQIELPSTWKDLHELADCGRKAIEKATGRRYRCGSISKIFRRTYSGSVVDYAYGAQKIPFVLVMELPALEYGFQPPKDKIKILTSESWIGVKAMCLRVAEIYAKNHINIRF